MLSSLICVYIAAIFQIVKMSEDVCYICLQPCTEDDKSGCTCESLAHFHCTYKYCVANQTTRCSICKSEDKRFAALKEWVESTNGPEDEEWEEPVEVAKHDWLRFMFCVTFIFSILFIAVSSNIDGEFVTLPPVAYIFIFAVSVPMAMTCSYKRRPMMYDDELEPSVEHPYATINV